MNWPPMLVAYRVLALDIMLTNENDNNKGMRKGRAPSHVPQNWVNDVHVQG